METLVHVEKALVSAYMEQITILSALCKLHTYSYMYNYALIH